MEKNTILRIGTIALLTAIFTLGIGFSALQTTLTINAGAGIIEGFPLSWSFKDIILDGDQEEIETKPIPNFATTATNEEGIFAESDDYGTSYYFRGAVTNNNVLFAGYQWKIIRIDGLGNIRMIYNGTEAQFNQNRTVNTTANTDIGLSLFNPAGYDNRYVGYMYGDTCDTYTNCHANINNSIVKEVLDNFYNNLSYDAKNNIVESIYCNDRSCTGTNCGIGTTTTNYGARVRLSTNKNPSLVCPREEDKLVLPIGLITADEIALAGGVQSMVNSNFYLHSGRTYWTMTPNVFMLNSVNVIRKHPSESLNFGIGVFNTAVAIRPVITLSGDVVISSGEGTASNPYRIS